MRQIKSFFTSKTPEKIFLWLSIPALAIFIFIIPALQGWDETTHFLRAYQVSTGDFISERIGKQAGGLIPDNISDMNDDALRDLQASAKSNLAKKADLTSYKTFVKQTHPDKASVNKVFSGSAVYSPISYAPQSAGIYLARTLRLPILSYVFIGRLFNAALFVLLVYWAIKLTPRGKWAIAAIALLPTTLTAAATLSPDTIINGVSLLLISLFLLGLFGKTRLSGKHLVAMTAAAIVLSLTKQAYFVLAFLPLCLPAKKTFGSVKRHLAWSIGIVILAVGLTLAWYAKVSSVAKYSYLDTRPNVNINSVAQESYIIHQPLHYLSTLSWEIFGRFNHIYTETVGLLTWKGIVMPAYIIFLSYIGILLAFLITRREAKDNQPILSNASKKIANYGPILIGLMSVVLIYTALYVGFNQVKATQIQGVQGRYFIPLIGLVLPWVVWTKSNAKPSFTLDSSRATYFLTWIFIIQIIAALFVVFATNYIPNIQFV